MSTHIELGDLGVIGLEDVNASEDRGSFLDVAIHASGPRYGNWGCWPRVDTFNGILMDVKRSRLFTQSACCIFRAALIRTELGSEDQAVNGSKSETVASGTVSKSGIQSDMPATSPTIGSVVIGKGAGQLQGTVTPPCPVSTKLSKSLNLFTHYQDL